MKIGRKKLRRRKSKAGKEHNLTCWFYAKAGQSSKRLRSEPCQFHPSAAARSQGPPEEKDVLLRAWPVREIRRHLKCCKNMLGLACACPGASSDAANGVDRDGELHESTPPWLALSLDRNKLLEAEELAQARKGWYGALTADPLASALVHAVVAPRIRRGIVSIRLLRHQAPAKPHASLTSLSRPDRQLERPGISCSRRCLPRVLALSKRCRIGSMLDAVDIARGWQMLGAAALPSVEEALSGKRGERARLSISARFPKPDRRRDAGAARQLGCAYRSIQGLACRLPHCRMSSANRTEFGRALPSLLAGDCGSPARSAR
ncbi:hypothetical protein L1887_42064 [Cichorium endivia]|nr:hypothetical protein L1887_42064 [Cichorium endivia]